MAYAKIIDGMINVGYYAERATPDGGSERVIVAKLVFPGTACTVARAIAVNQALLEGAVREEAERHGRGAEAVAARTGAKILILRRIL